LQNLWPDVGADENEIRLLLAFFATLDDSAFGLGTFGLGHLLTAFDHLSLVFFSGSALDTAVDCLSRGYSQRGGSHESHKGHDRQEFLHP
jgi:hypothetical protein